MKEPRYKIGQMYWGRRKYPHICTVKDIHRTYNSAGELVKTRYVATHETAGQIVEDSDVCETTIAIALAYKGDPAT